MPLLNYLALLLFNCYFVKLFNLILFFTCFIIVLAFRYLASSLPLLALVGVGIGVGLIFAMLVIGLAKNPLNANLIIR